LKDWDKVYRKKGEVQKEVLPIVKRAAALFKKRNLSRILDLGCGTGRHLVFLAVEGFDVYGSDISDTGLEITQKKLESLGFEPKLRKTRMDSLDFEDRFFDAVVSTFVINHAKLEKFRRTISEIERVLKNKGLFLLVVLSDKDEWFGKGKEIEKNTFLPDFFPEEADVPHHFFSEHELKEELRNFKILEFVHETGFSDRRKVKFGYFEVICQKVR
jgi:cyclopropane fatty-acyl-phospholipid synthase-like methyltransferase